MSLPSSLSRDLMTAEEVAAEFGLNVHTVRQRAARKRCWSVTKGMTRLFWRAEWEQEKPNMTEQNSTRGEGERAQRGGGAPGTSGKA